MSWGNWFLRQQLLSGTWLMSTSCPQNPVHTQSNRMTWGSGNQLWESLGISGGSQRQSVSSLKFAFHVFLRVQDDRTNLIKYIGIPMKSMLSENHNHYLSIVVCKCAKEGELNPWNRNVISLNSIPFLSAHPQVWFNTICTMYTAIKSPIWLQARCPNLAATVGRSSGSHFVSTQLLYDMVCFQKVKDS